MLSSVLNAKDCADCRFCCSFRRKSLWETPLFDPEKLEKIKAAYPEARFKEIGENMITIDLDGCYKTDDPEEEALCWFNKNGCVLDSEYKPFDCSIWPLRVMRCNGKLTIALTPTCPVISKKPPEVMKDLVEEEIGGRIIEEAHRHPEMIKDHKEGFPVLMEFDQCTENGVKQCFSLRKNKPKL